MVIPDLWAPEVQARLKIAGAKMLADHEAGNDPELELQIAFARAAFAATPD